LQRKKGEEIQKEGLWDKKAFFCNAKETFKRRGGEGELWDKKKKRERLPRRIQEKKKVHREKKNGLRRENFTSSIETYGGVYIKKKERSFVHETRDRQRERA
jgi:hypothetical protein